eukprot:TRINITY_DN62654_c0_g1_i1.p1 TRINITY_DN62654_c0_g1~~TRINITY_DN62654_c0_g1_i1.p1  ORF type:complete len:159 (-),score=47.22 TRINITY_DN62654_c0_g1_i1:131-607(-)
MCIRDRYLNLSHLSIQNPDELESCVVYMRELLEDLSEQHGRLHVLVNYDHFDCHPELVPEYTAQLNVFQDKYYQSVRRFSHHAFHRHKMANDLQVLERDQAEMGFEELSQLVRQLGLMVSEESLSNLWRHTLGPGTRSTEPNATISMAQLDTILRKLR